MSDEETQSVEAPASQAATPATESQQTHTESQETAQKKTDDQAYNWAETRRKMQELEKKNREYEEQISKIQKQFQPKEPEEDFGIKDEDLVEGKHIKELKKELKSLRSELKQKEAATVEDRLQFKYSDFNEIVTKENIELLKQTEPELANSLRYVSDPYEQGVAAYKLLKKMGPQSNSNSLEHKKAKENSVKPMSVNSVTKTSPIGNAHLFENGLTKELKSNLWKEMQDAMKRT